MKKSLQYTLAGLVALFIVIQLIPVPGRSNPPVESDVAAPVEIDAILRRSCYDCHSHETRWPWYNRIAPASWLVARDVKEGREHLNFSVWNKYDAKEKAELLEEAWHEVEEGEMPLWFYVPLHPEAKLSDEDKAALKEWTRRTSTLYETKAELEKAVGGLLKETEKAMEDAADELKKALEAAEDAMKDRGNSGPGSRDDDSI